MKLIDHISEPSSQLIYHIAHLSEEEISAEPNVSCFICVQVHVFFHHANITSAKRLLPSKILPCTHLRSKTLFSTSLPCRIHISILQWTCSTGPMGTTPGPKCPHSGCKVRSPHISSVASTASGNDNQGTPQLESLFTDTQGMPAVGTQFFNQAHHVLQWHWLLLRVSALHYSTRSQVLEGFWTVASAHALHQPTIAGLSISIVSIHKFGT